MVFGAFSSFSVFLFDVDHIIMVKLCLYYAKSEKTCSDGLLIFF